MEIVFDYSNWSEPPYESITEIQLLAAQSYLPTAFASFNFTIIELSCAVRFKEIENQRSLAVVNMHTAGRDVFNFKINPFTPDGCKTHFKNTVKIDGPATKGKQDIDEIDWMT